MDAEKTSGRIRIKKERVLFATDKNLEHYGNLSGSAESKILVYFPSFSLGPVPMMMLLL